MFAPRPQQHPSTPEKITRKTVSLYFIDRTSGILIDEKRELIRRIDTLTEIRETLMELFWGSKKGHISPVPEDTKLREVFQDNYQTVFVDTSRDLITRHPGGVKDEILTILSIIKTVRHNFPHVSRVQILVEGQEIESIAGHVMISKPLTGDEFNLGDSESP